MGRRRWLLAVGCWLLATVVVRAQGYIMTDAGQYHYSSVYYVTLQDDNGRSVNADYQETDGVIGAFVNGELRGVSRFAVTDAGSGTGVFVIRVWGNEADGATNVEFRLHHDDALYVLGTQPFDGGEDQDYGSPSAPLILTLIKATETSVFTFPEELTLSRLHDVILQLTPTPADAIIDASKVDIRFALSPHDGWGPVATAVCNDDRGCRWEVSGLFVGTYTFTVSYDGQPVLHRGGGTEGTVHIPAEYLFGEGWQWISLFAVPASGKIDVGDGNGWHTNGGSCVQQIRTQTNYLHYDPVYGYFGTLSSLSPSDGFVKTFTQYAGGEEGTLKISTGTARLTMATEVRLPQAHHGYTWLTYPHELNHKLSVIERYLSATASEGDMIIGQDVFAEFTDGEWVPNDVDCLFEAGRGYIYYTSDTQSKSIDWGPVSLPPDPEPEETRNRIRRAVAHPWPDMMPLVARLRDDGLPTSLMVTALVEVPESQGELRATRYEVRGTAPVSANGWVRLAVGGSVGEKVKFIITDTITGCSKPLQQQVDFTGHVGSSRAPLELTAMDPASCPKTTAKSTIRGGVYDLQGRPVSTPLLQKGVYIINGRKVIK